MSGLRRLLRREDGQTLILVVLALPTVLLAMTALVIDGSKLFVERRSVQNAADAIALAIADKDLDPYGGGCLPASSCLTTAQYYSPANGGPAPGTLHACDPALPTDTNCYLTPYKGSATRVQVRLTKTVSTVFGKVINFSSVNVSASAAATVRSGGRPLVAYAMQATDGPPQNNPNCDAIQIHGPNGNSDLNGGNVFPGLWSNGGISATDQNNRLEALLLDSVYNPSPCPLPDMTSSAWHVCVGDAVNCPVGSAPQSKPPLYVPKRPCPSTGSTIANCAWPKPIPSNPCTAYSNSNADTTVGDTWMNTHPRGGTLTSTHPLAGVYCATSFSIGASGTAAAPLDFTGYTFIASSDSGPTSGITLTNAQWDTFGCTGANPCSVPNTVFYAVNGDFKINSCTVSSSPPPGYLVGDANCFWVGNSDIYAPNDDNNNNGGAISFSGGSNATFNGFMEAQTITINAKSATFTGTGALVGDPQISLDE